MTTIADFEGILLTEVGTNQVHITVYDGTIYFTILGTGQDNPFFSLDKKDWEKVKNFIENKDVQYKPIKILEKQKLLP